MKITSSLSRKFSAFLFFVCLPFPDISGLLGCNISMRVTGLPKQFLPWSVFLNEMSVVADICTDLEIE